MKAVKKDASPKYVLTLSEEEAGLLMTLLVEGEDWGDYPVGREVYDALEAAGAEEC